MTKVKKELKVAGVQRTWCLPRQDGAIKRLAHSAAEQICVLGHLFHPGILEWSPYRQHSGLPQVGQILPTKSPEIRLKQAYFDAIAILGKMCRCQGSPFEAAADAALLVTAILWMSDH